MMSMLGALGDNNLVVLWLGVVGVALLVGFLSWWIVRRRSVELDERERAHRCDADWGSRPSDGMEL
jgi:cytochrome c-type biogenesis protein CcmH/NrfF